MVGLSQGPLHRRSVPKRIYFKKETKSLSHNYIDDVIKEIFQECLSQSLCNGDVHKKHP